MSIINKIQRTNTYNRIRNAFFRHVMNPLAYRITSRYRIMTSFDSIRYILNYHCSVSRYGDGEFYVMMGEGNGFQEPNPKLAERLKQVILANDAPNHMVGIPLPMKDVSGLIDGFPPFFWRYYMGKHVFFIDKFIQKDRQYLNTQLSRFYYEVRNKSRCGEQLELLKRIWGGRNLFIVEGVQTRSGVGNDLYDNARRVRRLLCPATNAFDKYDDILDSIQKYAEKDELILLSLGMTATVLAYDLAKLGCWAIDMGHLDIEYEWYLLGENGMKKPPIEGKFVNEAVGGNNSNIPDCNDSAYISQIVCKVL